MTSPTFLTRVSASVPAEREHELRDGFRDLFSGSVPDGLLRSELVQGQDGRWSIQTLWRDLEALRALRRTGAPPAAGDLLARVGAEHVSDHGTVAEAFPA